MEKSITDLSLFIGCPTNRSINWRVVMALWDTQAVLRRGGIKVTLGLNPDCSRVERARNTIAWTFLASDFGRLLWLDDDQVFTPEDVLRLLRFSLERDIVGAVYPQKHEPIELRYATRERFMPCDELGLIKVDGMGLGFTMVTRKVMEDVMSEAPLAKFDSVESRMPMIFRSRLSDTMEDVGEDIGFFRDCRALGYEVYVDPTMKIGHIGTKVYEGTLAELSQAKPLAESA